VCLYLPDKAYRKESAVALVRYERLRPQKPQQSTNLCKASAVSLLTSIAVSNKLVWMCSGRLPVLRKLTISAAC
jgi:hypothetical protein